VTWEWVGVCVWGVGGGGSRSVVIEGMSNHWQVVRSYGMPRRSRRAQRLESRRTPLDKGINTVLKVTRVRVVGPGCLQE
jgi:hypothetical protein